MSLLEAVCIHNQRNWKLDPHLIEFIKLLTETLEKNVLYVGEKIKTEENYLWKPY